MPNKTERAAEISRFIINDKKALLREYSRTVPDKAILAQFQLRNGASVKLNFKALDSVMALLHQTSAPFENPEEWNTLEVRTEGQVKLKVRFRGTDVIPLAYLPGVWEQKFGVDPSGDTEILLPPALRDSGSFPLSLGGQTTR